MRIIRSFIYLIYFVISEFNRSKILSIILCTEIMSNTHSNVCIKNSLTLGLNENFLCIESRFPVRKFAQWYNHNNY